MKKILKIIALIALVLVIIVSWILYIVSVDFAKLRFRDDFAVAYDFSNLFPESYDSARYDFRKLSARIMEEHTGVQIDNFLVPSDVCDYLTVDLCYLPAQKDSMNLLILISGVHGIEGPVGHAVQRLFVSEFLDSQLVSNTGVLMVHGVNPYGFKYHRRVTENNVDLNRNSTLSDNLFDTKNEGYTRVYDLINPMGKVNVSSFENRFFFLKALNEIRKATLPVLRQAVLQGQYEHPKGLYFGGEKREPQIDSLIVLMEKFVKPYNRILVIDIHTGFGERGRLHFFPNPMEGEQRARMENLFRGYNIDWGDTGDFYTITGDFAGFIASIAQGKEVYPMLFEYGTLNSQTILGSLKSIHIMVLENQGRQFGFYSPKDSLRVVGDFIEMYYPSSENWRNHVMEQTREVFEVILPRFVAGSE